MRRLVIAFAVVAGVVVLATVTAHQRTFETRRLAAAAKVLDDGVLRVVVLGDSVARGAGDERGGGIPRALDGLLPRAAATVNLGINGARTRDVRRLLTQAPARSALRTADVIVLSIGGNDLYGDSIARLLAAFFADHRQNRTVARLQGVVTKLREVNPAARIYVLGLYNPYRRARAGAWLDEQVNRWDARVIARFAADRAVTVVRICDLLGREDRISALDHFHPGAAGYAAIAERLVSAMDLR